MSCVFGFDVGSRLTGVAVGNVITSSARALGTVAMHAGEPDWQRLDAMQREWLPHTLVIGLPLTLEDAEQPASVAARRFAARLHARYALPTTFIDERDSSREASQRFAHARASGLKRRRDAVSIDAEAAAVILERWLLLNASTPPGIDPS